MNDLERKNAFDASLVMGTAAFHRATGRDEHEARVGVHTEEIPRNFRGCPVCGRYPAYNSSLLFLKGPPAAEGGGPGGAHLKCPCGMLYVEDPPTPEWLAEHYALEDSWGKVLESEPQQEFDRLKYEYGLEILRRLCNQTRAPASLLDVGCGPGYFLKLAREYGWTCAGIEPNEAALSLAKDNAPKYKPMVRPRIEKWQGYRFIAVTMWEVLEHLADPLGMLREIHGLMVDRGRLLLLVPNADGLAIRMLRERHATFDGTSHLNFFNVNTLAALLTRAGFELIHAETLITELGVINNWLGWASPYEGREATAYEPLTPGTIHDRLWGGKLLVIARKV